jgi:mannosyltransferase OCH1-like enzyme
MMRHRYHSNFGTNSSTNKTNNAANITSTSTASVIRRSDANFEINTDNSDEGDDDDEDELHRKKHRYRWLRRKMSQHFHQHLPSYIFAFYVSMKAMTTKLLQATRSMNTVKAVVRKGYVVVLLSMFLLIISVFAATAAILVSVVGKDRIGLDIDDALQQRYHQSIILQQRRAFYHLYPDVTIKATRKTERHQYSYYLYELLLHRHQIRVKEAISEVSHQKTNHYKYKVAEIVQPSKWTSRIQIDGISNDVLPINNSLKLATNGSRAVFKHQGQLQHWWCDRCLHTGYRGSYQQCQFLCSWHYLQQMYFPNSISSSLITPQNETTQQRSNNIPASTIRVSYVEVHPAESLQVPPQPYSRDSNNRQIPHIIHQAWDKVITTLEYPELARIQNTWRSVVGYEYHFYTLPLQLRFVRDHYPVTILQIYESITDMEQRYSLFQLLVLYKVGGVYANTDVVLEVNLNALLESDDTLDDEQNEDKVSLIVVRNPNVLQAHCTYTVLIAATPGHSIIARMLESTLQIIAQSKSTLLSRILPSTIWKTYFRSITRYDETSSFPIWKLHTSSSFFSDYMYGGSCVWGIHINRALQHHPLMDLNVWGPHRIFQTDSSSGTSSSTTDMNIGNGTILILMVRDKQTSQKLIDRKTRTNSSHIVSCPIVR